MDATIVMPAYNSAPFIGPCMDSVLGQTDRDIELIIVDDGSTDGTWELICECARRDDRLTALRQEHAYAGSARNLGLERALGEFVLFLDSDDLFEPQMVERAVKRMRATEADICIFGGRRFSEEPGDTDAPNYLKADLAPNRDSFSPREISEHVFQIINPAPWTKCYRRDFVVESGLGFQQYENSNDVFFTFSTMTEAGTITVLPENFAWYRYHPGSSQHSKRRQPLAFLRALLAVKARLIRRGAFETFERSFLKSALNQCSYCIKQANRNGDLEALEATCTALASFAAFELGFLDPEAQAFLSSCSGAMRRKLSSVLAVVNGADPYEIYQFDHPKQSEVPTTCQTR